jgi:tubulin-folding cofactor B
MGIDNFTHISELQGYIKAQDETRYDNVMEGFVRLDVTHSNLEQKWHDLMFAVDMTVGEVKAKLYRHGGTSCCAQELFLRRGPGDTIFLHDDNLTLRHFGICSGMGIHIKDNDPHSLSANGGLENVALVQKYEMDDDTYDQRENTVRRSKQAEQAKRAREKAAELAANPPPARPETPRDVAEKYPIGGRCEINPGGRRGEVAYVGKIKKTEGTWIGVRLDEPLGQNDGTKEGARYFECQPKYGAFGRIENVQVGDFPEIDPFASDDEDEI